jgi:hypothetical protein
MASARSAYDSSNWLFNLYLAHVSPPAIYNIVREGYGIEVIIYNSFLTDQFYRRDKTVVFI